ncbi:hypothetical protein NQ318_003477 [Aromia moschata]|uniref:Tyr recombinase domain-containing protein n=1 Tax=Aromia moschata TaxID=1265417 RepID=A0AAV8YXA6_9CUCU|nr:hypothetical protein NQ318_003477 [Aromia moschata]
MLPDEVYLMAKVVVVFGIAGACRICEISQVTLDDIEDSVTSSATLLVESGGDLMTLKNHGGWKSSTVDEGYVDESVAHRTEIANKVFRTCGSAEITPDLRPVGSSG